MVGKTNLISIRTTYYFAIASLFLSSCRQTSNSLELVKELSTYPSGSSIEYYNDHFYLMGDDATYLLKLNNELELVDTIKLYSGLQRMPKDTKPDLEGSTVFIKNDTPFLFLAGSGSGTPFRNTGWTINLLTNEKRVLNLDSFYNRLSRTGIEELNIEGVAATKDEFLLVSRGNKSDPKNYLIHTPLNFWEDSSFSGKWVEIGQTTDTSSFNGISGLAYLAKTDELILSVSTEDTYNRYDDGAIGKSYLWIIKNFSSRKGPVITPDQVIDLEELDSRLKGQKIESVCVISANASSLDLLLTADNDNGKTVLFRLRI